MPTDVNVDEDDQFDPPDEGAEEDSGPELSPEERFKKNLAALARVEPSLHAELVNYKPVSRLVFDEDGNPNVAYQDFMLYPDGQQKYLDDQLKSYVSHAYRMTMNSVGDGAGLDLHSKDWFDSFTKRVDDSGLTFTHMPYRENAYFAIVLGIGLGGHIETVLERTGCRVLVLIEPNLDFIYHSLSVFDWVGLLEKYKDRGVFYILRRDSPTTLSEEIKSMFRMHNPASLDGTVVFQHYSSTIFSEIHKKMNDTLRTAVMGLGFFQDEVNMIGQTYKNLGEGKSRVIKRLEERPGLPAFIVATGPSLDKLIPFLKENQDKAAIFSCGTSIHILMKNGIKPDFWVMAERGYGAYTVIRDANEDFDLSDVRFVGSTTVFPEMPKLFKEAIYFLRPGLSVAPLFARSRDQIATIPDPMAANAGLSFALHVGFREVYFIGVDTGSRRQDRGHAAGSWYEQQLSGQQLITNLDLPVPGNFGGTVWTLPVYQWSRESLEKLIEIQRGRVFYNLGDGALIKGAAPLHPKACKLKAPEITKAELVTRLIESCPVYSTTDFEMAWEQGAVIDRLSEFCEKLKDVVRQNENCDDFEYIRETSRMLRPAHADDAVCMLFRGTVFTVLTVYEYYANRAIDPDERVTMYQLFVEEYCELLDSMRDRAVEIFLGLEEGEPWEDEFIK